MLCLWRKRAERIVIEPDPERIDELIEQLRSGELKITLVLVEPRVAKFGVDAPKGMRITADPSWPSSKTQD